VVDQRFEDICSWHSLHNYIYYTSDSVVNSNYSMLLGKPWLRDAKVAHDLGSNIVTIQGNGIVRTITITKHLGGEIKRP
jgi:hypothetical protein